MDYTLEYLLAEEAELRLASFSNDAAWRLGQGLARKARSEGLAIAVGIVRGGQRLFWYAAAGTSPDNDAWLERKIRTVLRFGHSSLHMGLKLRSLGLSAREKYQVDEAEYSFHGGALPIALRGSGVIGALAVSGLSQERDHELGVWALRALKG